MKYSVIILGFGWILGFGSRAYAEVPDLQQRVVEHTCSNGIKLLILERHFSPTVAIRMMFRTGAVDEVSGKTGLAHMFEHMMFKGTHTLGTKDYAKEIPLLRQIDSLHEELDAERLRNPHADPVKIKQLSEKLSVVEKQENEWVSENELWNLYEREGSSDLNAGTSRDFTQYVVDLPSNKIELWAIIDSDRVKNPVFRQFYQEREVVKEERRMRVDTDAEGKLYENFIAAAYVAHPYHHPTIGWESDLDHLSVADLRDFYQRNYTPNQLTISIVGDVNAAHVTALVDKYFGDWKIKEPARPPVTLEPVQVGMRRVTVRFEAQPHLLMGFHIPTYPDPDQVNAYAVAQLLGSGTTSRLYKSLVEKKKIATAVETASDEPGERYDSLLVISAAPRFPHTSQEVEQAISEELDRLKSQPIQEWEMAKLRAAVAVGLLSTLQTNKGMADTLAYDQSIFGDWKYLLTFQRRINEMTPGDLQKAARQYLTSDNETVATLEPVKVADGPPKPSETLRGNP